MKRVLLEFQLYCKTCNTITYLDKRLPSGPYNLVVQRYGKIEYLRFAFEGCPFCTFDEDILSMFRKEE